MDIDEMPAGPELDALIAEKVMGVDLSEHDDDNDGWCTRCGAEISQFARMRAEYIPTRCDGSPASTDIAVAWEVVEKVCRWGFALHTPRNEEKGDAAWKCIIATDATGYGVTVHAPTAPLAICRAALKAVQ